jgi:hypothetical protein
LLFVVVVGIVFLILIRTTIFHHLFSWSGRAAGSKGARKAQAFPLPSQQSRCARGARR